MKIEFQSDRVRDAVRAAQAKGYLAIVSNDRADRLMDLAEDEDAAWITELSDLIGGQLHSANPGLDSRRGRDISAGAAMAAVALAELLSRQA